MEMPEAIHALLELVARAVEIAGAGILILGFIIATSRWVVQLVKLGKEQAIENYRKSIGRVILIGL
jgi:hypothetical protein